MPPKATPQYNLAVLHPELAKLWHHSRNGNLTPYDVTPGSNKIVWWLCSTITPCGCTHEYEQAIYSKVGGNRGCPFCSNPPKRHCFHKSLAFICPDISRFWHPTKNGYLTPEHFTPMSNKEAYWICTDCPYGCIHEYKQTIDKKVLQNQGCPMCAPNAVSSIRCIHRSLEFLYPEISAQWNLHRNGDLKPSQVAPYSEQLVWWNSTICEKGCINEYQQTVRDKTLGIAIPAEICIHKSLQYLFPHVAKWWHPSKNNGIKASHVTPDSHQKVWWLCPHKCKYGCPHEYQRDISDQVYRYSACPFCTCVTKYMCIHQSLGFLYPQIAKLLHPVTNTIDPLTVTPFSHKEAWWICPTNNTHIYKRIIAHMVSHPSCPRCHPFGYSYVSQEWLRYMEVYHNNKIQRHETTGEYNISGSKYRADGYCEETKTIYEFQGTYYHGDPRIYDKDKVNPTTNTTYGELYQRTLDKKNYCLAAGYKYVECWELDWRRGIKALRIIQRKFRQHRRLQYDNTVVTLKYIR